MAKVSASFVACRFFLALITLGFSHFVYGVDADSILGGPSELKNLDLATIKISLKANKLTPISPLLYGLTLDESALAYDGGLSPELLQNGAIVETNGPMKNWAIGKVDQAIDMCADDTAPLTETHPSSIRLKTLPAGEQLGTIVNGGFFGVPLRPSTKYHLSMYAKGSTPTSSTLVIRLLNGDGSVTFAKGETAAFTDKWQKLELELTTGEGMFATPDGLLGVSNPKDGTVWFNLVSLTAAPSPYASGFRADLMDKLKDLKPGFIAIPGPLAIRGTDLTNRFNWKEMRGPLVNRRAHTDAKGFVASGAIGILELMECCEDLNAEPVLMVFDGCSVPPHEVDPGPFLDPYVQDALDEVEYLTGDASTYWGGLRAKDGHPNPFKINYVEIGDGEYADPGQDYNDRFVQFSEAFKTKYPDLKLIAALPVVKGPPEFLAESELHVDSQFIPAFKKYEEAHRGGQKFFIQGWGIQIPHTDTVDPQQELDRVMSYAEWMLMMEKNSDVVTMSSYSSALAHIRATGALGTPDLINYDGLTSFGTPTYYVQRMFASHYGTVMPTSEEQSAEKSEVPYNVTMDADNGLVYVKMVNPHPAPQPVDIVITGAGTIDPAGQVVSLHFEHPEDANTLKEPNKVVAVTQDLSDMNYSYKYTLAPNSVTVLTFNAKLPGT